jgi:hypothetical protein
MRMPFGKYRSWLLEEVPHGYLLWRLDHCERLCPTLREAICRQLGVRQGARWEAPIPDWDEVLRTWCGQLVLDFHPDRGGSTEAMQAVNEAYHRLTKMIGLAVAESHAGRDRGTAGPDTNYPRRGSRRSASPFDRAT